MRPANILMDIQDFSRLQDTINANNALANMFKSFQKAIDEGDNVFSHPLLWTFEASWSEVFYDILEGYEFALTKLPWLDPDVYQMLYSTLFSLNTTNNSSDSLQSINTEFENENNGILCFNSTSNEFHVFDMTSWYELHCNYTIKYPKWIDWTENQILSNTEYSDLLIVKIVEIVDGKKHTFEKAEDKIHHFNTDLVRTFRADKDAVLKLASEIARRNGYLLDLKLSKSEKKRRKVRMSAVFKVEKNDEFQYLSLDTENAQFEVCNKKGEHIGVWNFSGSKTGEADEKGGHNIVIGK
jgi:hypothetical protein